MDFIKNLRNKTTVPYLNYKYARPHSLTHSLIQMLWTSRYYTPIKQYNQIKALDLNNSG